MSIQQLKNEDFDANGNLKVLQNKKVVVLFYADYCPACQAFKPVYKDSADSNNNSGIVFCAVSTPDNRDLMKRVSESFPFEVQYIPTVVGYSNGKYYSTYDYDKNDPEDRKTYRTKGDLMEYAKGIGSSKINFK